MVKVYNKLVFLVFLGVTNLVQGQDYTSFDKCVVSKKIACISNDIGGKKTLYLSGEGFNAGQDSITSAFLTNELFYRHPLAWDIVNDSLIFVVDMYDDHTGMTYADLRKYNMKEMDKMSDSGYKNYIEDNKRMITKNIPPITAYSFDIAYGANKTKESIYYDISCDSDSFFLFVYIKQAKRLEKWIFTHFPRYTEPNSNTAIESRNKKAWEKVATCQMDLDSPFRIIRQNKKTYLITANNESYRLDASDFSVKKTTFKRKDTEMILIDKEKDEVRLIPVILPSQRSSIQRKQLIRASKRIKLK